MRDAAEAIADTLPTLLLDQARADLSNLTDVIEATAAAARAPNNTKVVRTFTPGEAAEFIGVTTQHLAVISDELQLDLHRAENTGARAYSLSHMNQLRKELAKRVGENSTKGMKYDPQRRDGEDLSVVAFVNFKGGSAKTTTSVHFAQYLALKGYRVLFLDLDPQGSASTVFGYQPVLVTEDETVNAALRYEDRRSLKDVIKKTYFDNIDIGLGGQWMSEWEQDTPRVMTEANYKEAQAQIELEDIEQELLHPNLTVKRLKDLEVRKRDTLQTLSECSIHKQYFLRLKRALKDVAGDYDVVVCDTQPALHFVSQATIGAAKHLIITIQPEWLDIKSMQQYLTALCDHLATLSEHAHLVGEEARYINRTMNYLTTRFEPNDTTMRAISGMMTMKLGAVLRNPMPKSAAVSQAGLQNSTLYEGSGKDFTRSTFKRGLEAMNAVNKEMEEIVLKGWGRI